MIVYEDDYILICEYNNGTMIIDKNTDMMISWEGGKAESEDNT